MGATPIPPHLVHTVFQYILPPSLPLPPHLLSNSLTERHHFLSIPPTDSASYLCWPSSDVASVIEALERGISDTVAAEPEHDVRYTSPDEETVLAHVRPDTQSPLQIVFAWDAESATWRYHDACMLPFPEASQPLLDAVLTDELKPDSGLEWPSLIIEPPSPPSILQSASSASDNYWAGYESSGSSPESSALPSMDPTEEDDKAEAAYWASYGAVHGSGDSTLPSPKLDRRCLPQSERPLDARGPETTFDPLLAHLHLRLQQEHGGSLSTSLSRSQHDSYSAQSWETPNGEERQQTTLEQLGHGQQAQDDDYRFFKDVDSKAVEPDALQLQHEKEVSAQGTDRNGRDDREDGLREAIRGIYRIWRAQSGSEDPSNFIDIVKDVLEI